MTDERRYTLSEAERVLARRECTRLGHDFDVIVIVGSEEPQSVVCSRCDESWPVEAKSNVAPSS